MESAERGRTVTRTASLLPPVLQQTERGQALGAAADGAYSLEPWLACPLHVETSPDEALWSLARQFDVAGPLMQAMRTRAQRERLIRSALLLQKKRGAPWSVEEVMRLIGYSDAYVIDRKRMGKLAYDGEAAHDGIYAFDGGGGIVKLKRYRGDTLHDGPWGGSHVFDGVTGYYQYQWTDYRIRLYIDSNSRPFEPPDMAEAFMLAEGWAPLRATLIGWDARHCAASVVSDPSDYASGVLGVALEDAGGNAALVYHWAQPLQGGAVAIRWRSWFDDLPMGEVCAVGLVGKDGRELERVELPPVAAAENVIYEGFWKLEAA